MTRVLFLEPHQDDGCLFAAFQIIRHRPHVVTVLRGFKQRDVHGFDVDPEERERENAAAMAVLGARPHQQWSYSDVDPDWDAIGVAVADLRPHYKHCIAPCPEDDGHPHHNEVGEIARAAFGRGNVTLYMTYTSGRGRSKGEPVPFENEWVAAKLCALSHFTSQIRLDSTCHHFMQPLNEYVA